MNEQHKKSESQDRTANTVQGADEESEEYGRNDHGYPTALSMVYVNKQTLEDMKKWIESEAPMVYRFQDFQKDSGSTATYPGRMEETGLLYLVAGLTSEVGECAGKIAKTVRDHKGSFNDERCAAISKELGDCLWFISELCTHFQLSLEDVAIENREKLRDRMERGVLGGSGDNR